MSFLRKEVLCTIFIFLYLTCCTQTLRFNRYTTSDGLLSDEVYNLHQDKMGYIWAFTNYGVVKYNGSEFKQVLKNLPFNESFVYSFYENEQGRKWMANSTGKIFEIRHDSAFQVKGTEETSELLRKAVSEIGQLHVDDSLNIYALTKHHSYKFINGKKGYYPVNLSTGIKDSIAYRIYEKNNKLFRVLNYYDNDSIYCGGRENLKLLFYTKNRVNYIKLDCGLSQPRTFKKFGSTIYFSHHENIFKINENNILSTINFHSLIMNFTKDKKGHLWVACYNNGLFELNEKDSVINHYFEKTTINDVLIDSQNGLWASSIGSGLFHCVNLNDHYFAETTPLGKPINFIKIIGDELFVANNTGDILTIKNQQTLPGNFKKQQTHDEPFDIIKNKNGYILVNRYSIDFSEFYKKQTVHSVQKPIHAIKIIQYKPDSVFFLQRRGLYIMENYVFRKLLNFNYRAYCFEVRNGKVLVAMENGIWQVAKNKLWQPAYLKSTRDMVFKSIVKDSSGNYWFCSTGNGLFKLTPENKLVHYQVSNGLASNIINNISFTSTGCLLSTNTGLYFAQTLTNENKPYSWKSIYSGSVQNALLFENQIYLSTNNGLIILDKKKIYDLENLHFNLSSIRVNSQEVLRERFKTLKHDENSLEFIFDLISFNKESYSLKYNLISELNDSGSVKGKSISFKKLNPGNYTLTIYPDVVNGAKLKLKIAFYIAPAFWQTPAFLMLVSILILVMSGFAVLYIFKSVKEKETKRNNAERLILEYKLIALKAQINPHFMSNCLTAIQHLIINNQLHKATDYIGKFGQLVRQILNFSTRSLITLNEELEIAVLNIELEQLRFEKKFLFKINVDPGLNTTDIFIPALILNPIIENAIWHGLIPLKNERDGRLFIEARLDKDTLLLVIEDNGVGRTHKDDNLSNTRESKGIALTEQRLNNINYMFNVTTSQLVYTDLVNENNHKFGTRVTISLPINLKPLQNE